MAVRLLIALSLALLIAADAPAVGAFEAPADAAAQLLDSDGNVGEQTPLGAPLISTRRPVACADDALPSSPSLDRLFRPPRAAGRPSR